MKRAMAWVVAVAAAVGLSLAAAPAGTAAVSASSAAAPYCGIVWGSLDKSANPMLGAGPVTGIRAGRHDCYDRLVFDVAGPAPQFTAGYVSSLTEDPSGRSLALRGGAILHIVVIADSFTSYLPKNRTDVLDVTGCQTFRQVAFAGSFENHYSVGLGVRARLPFRVFTLDAASGGSRLVVDVAHYW
jgi:hypothetical protein